MGDHGQPRWPSVQKAWCFRVHRAQELGTKHTRQQLQSLLAATAVELHVTDYNPHRNWFYQVLKRHKLENKRSGYKRVHIQSTDTEDYPSVPGQAASIGPIHAIAKKNREIAETDCKGGFRYPHLYTVRPSSRIVDDGYDSDTRPE